MRKRKRSIPWNSIPVKLVLGLLAITVPLIALLLYNNHYSVNVIHNQVAATNKSLISIHMKQIDDQLSEVERHLLGLTYSDSNLLAMGKHVPADDYVMAKSSVSRMLSSDLIVYPYIDGFFVYSIPRRDMMEVFKQAMGYEQLMSLRQTLERLMDESPEGPVQKEWTVQPSNGETYIVRLFRTDDVYIGAWARAKTVLAPLREMSLGKTGAVLLVDGAGRTLGSTQPLADEAIDFARGFQTYYLSGRHEDYLVVGETSSKGEFSLAAAIPDKQMLENLPYLANAAKVVVGMAILMLALSMWFLRKVLLLPLRKLMVTMRLIGEGNWTLQIEESPASDEFQLVNRTFNRMISRIEELKINVYEEQLSKQRAELKQLQLQINPHFFMNSLNILFHLAQGKQYQLIQEMTLCLVHYFRYMFQNDRPLVLLKDELQHVRNYLRIQQLRLPNRLSWDIRVPDYLAETPIPPAMLQTFVENTMKHGVRATGSTVLTVEASLDTLAEAPTVCISVRDNGKGFSDEALEAIRGGKPLLDETGEHIGLWNARERLRLQFGDKAWLECYNDDPQGAVTELYVPLQQHPEHEEWTNGVPSINRR
ncbi:histidine kinase [Paenibacillus sp.]|uniref:cache domain-containing sensor histidine kinase n=1 Tax=Paenibacillus sp. TaxID=58172 RepID=UPI002811C68E|nr:histidine kinase [Paenibacillus sp.]